MRAIGAQCSCQIYCIFIFVQSDLYYPRYLGVLNFGLKNRGIPRSADNRGIDNRNLTVLHISWAYQILASKTADNPVNRGLTVYPYTSPSLI